MEGTGVQLKTSLEILKIKKACIIIESIFRDLADFIKPGLQTIQINAFCEERIAFFGGVSAIKGYNGFPSSVCVSVNNVIAHGIPNDYALSDGDIVSVDISLSKDGWFGDGTWTYLIGKGNPDSRRLIKAAWQSARAGIDQAVVGKTIGDIGAAVALKAMEWGCEVFSEYAGHGIGREMHEEPLILHTNESGSGLRIIPGMVFTVEPILTLGKAEIGSRNGPWTIRTKDSRPTAQYEHTLAVFKDKTEVLTGQRIDWESCLDFPPFF